MLGFEGKKYVPKEKYANYIGRKWLCKTSVAHNAVEDNAANTLVSSEPGKIYPIVGQVFDSENKVSLIVNVNGRLLYVDHNYITFNGGVFSRSCYPRRLSAIATEGWW